MTVHRFKVWLWETLAIRPETESRGCNAGGFSAVLSPASESCFNG